MFFAIARRVSNLRRSMLPATLMCRFLSLAGAGRRHDGGQAGSGTAAVLLAHRLQRRLCRLLQREGVAVERLEMRAIGRIVDRVAQGAVRGLDLEKGVNRARPQGSHVGIERSEEHNSELQSLMRISYVVFCLKQKKKIAHTNAPNNTQ